MDEREFEAGEELPEPELDALPSEVPEADAVEQHQSAAVEPGYDIPRSIPRDASEADVLEQSQTVLDDDEPDI